MINIKKELHKDSDSENMFFNDVDLDPEKIKAIMINEVVPIDADDDFYGKSYSLYMSTTVPLFQNAGADVESIKDILNMGIYITNAVKVPKSEYEIPRKVIEESVPFLERELSLFPNIKVIMLMGDVAKKAFNIISKKHNKKNVIPAIATYKMRNTEFYYNDIRILPSYIITGKNILIEKSKFAMASEDIEKMIKLIK